MYANTETLNLLQPCNNHKSFVWQVVLERLVCYLQKRYILIQSEPSSFNTVKNMGHLTIITILASTMAKCRFWMRLLNLKRNHYIGINHAPLLYMGLPYCVQVLPYKACTATSQSVYRMEVFIMDIFKGTTLIKFQRLNKINRNWHLATMYISKIVIHHNVNLGKMVTWSVTTNLIQH